MKSEKEIIPLQILKETCHGCPMVWDGYTQNGSLEVYIRYRHGYLSMTVGGECVMNIHYITTCGADGVMSQKEMITVVNENSNYSIKRTGDIMGPE